MEDHNKKKIIGLVAIILIMAVLFFGFQTVTTKMAVKEGVKYLSEKEYEKAYTSFGKAEKKHGLFANKTDIRYYEGECLMFLERFDEAAAVYDKISETRAMAMKGFAHQRAGEKKEAVKAFKEAIKKDSSDGIGYYYLYAYYVDQKDYKKALKVIEGARDTGVQNMAQEIDFARVVLYEKMLRYQDALAAAKEYVAAYPDDETGRKELAFLETR